MKGVVLWSVLGIILGVIFAIVTNGWEAGPAGNGVIIGLLIGSIGASVESFLFQERFRRLRFSLVLLWRVLFYLVLISTSSILIIALYQSSKNNVSFLQGFSQPGFRRFLMEGEFLSLVIYVAVAGVIINFLRQVNRLLGQNVLLNYITGKYHQPVEEERIFMFLDVNSSTTIAERLGHIAYHRLLNDFFFDITGPIVESGGEIYQYVGDEVVVTWTMKRGVPGGCSIACFFRIREKIAARSAQYLEAYGVVPGFKAGFHYGRVITAEVGDIKKEIAFHGDVVNTASRIQSECRVLGRDILVSSDLLERLALPFEFEPERIGAIRLRGKERDVELYSVCENPEGTAMRPERETMQKAL
jgi:adenylate cyclase